MPGDSRLARHAGVEHSCVLSRWKCSWCQELARRFASLARAILGGDRSGGEGKKRKISVAKGFPACDAKRRNIFSSRTQPKLSLLSLSLSPGNASEKE